MVEVEALTVAAAATTTSEGAAAAGAAAISGAAAEEDLDEGAVVEALINSKTKGLQNVSSVSRLHLLCIGNRVRFMLLARLVIKSPKGKSVECPDSHIIAYKEPIMKTEMQCGREL